MNIHPIHVSIHSLRWWAAVIVFMFTHFVEDETSFIFVIWISWPLRAPKILQKERVPLGSLSKAGYWILISGGWGVHCMLGGGGWLAMKKTSFVKDIPLQTLQIGWMDTQNELYSNDTLKLTAKTTSPSKWCSLHPPCLRRTGTLSPCLHVNIFNKISVDTTPALDGRAIMWTPH